MVLLRWCRLRAVTDEGNSATTRATPVVPNNAQTTSSTASRRSGRGTQRRDRRPRGLRRHLADQTLRGIPRGETDADYVRHPLDESLGGPYCRLLAAAVCEEVLRSQYQSLHREWAGGAAPFAEHRLRRLA